MLAAWRFLCWVMEGLSDRFELRGIIYSAVRNQDSWTRGVYSTLLSTEVCGTGSRCVCSFYPASSKYNRGCGWSAVVAVLFLFHLGLYFQESVTQHFVSALWDAFGAVPVVDHCLWQLSNTISVLEKHPPSYYQRKNILNDKNSNLHLSDNHKWIVNHSVTSEQSH